MSQATVTKARSRRTRTTKTAPSVTIEEDEAVESPASPDAMPAVENRTIQALTLFLDESEYAIPILRVREIASYGSVTPVPTTPVWIRGVMNLRGTVVPVVDLRAKLGLGVTTVTRRTCLVIVELAFGGEEMVMAVVVDGVNRVIDLSPEDIQEPPAFGTRVEVAFLDGLIHFDDRLVLLLDLNRVLSAVELAEMRGGDLQGSPSPSKREE